MSGLGPAGEGGQNPFQNIFGDIARLLGGASGPLNWDVARQVGVLIAGEGQAEPNVDPVERMRLEELAHIAQLHVEQVTGMSVVVSSVEAVTHVDWATRTLEDYHALLISLAASLGRRPDDAEPDFGAPDDAQAMAQFAQMEKFLSPVLLGMQAGGMVGHLSRRTLGQYDLPIPRGANSTLVLVPANIDAFADDWSLPRDELSLYVAIEELTRLVIFERAHVRERFTHLITEYVSGFEPNYNELQERLGEFDLTDPTQLPSALSDPQALLGAMQSPAQQQTLVQLNALVAAFVGYVDWAVAQIAPRVTSSHSAIAEAVKRRRVEESDGARLVERLFGLEMGQPQFDRGTAFVQGVVERAGEDGLARLWRSAAELPTPAEIDAPGLWLARIDIPSES